MKNAWLDSDEIRINLFPITEFAVFLEGAAEAVAGVAGRSACMQALDDLRGGIDTPAVEGIQGWLHLHHGALEGRLADTL